MFAFPCYIKDFNGANKKLNSCFKTKVKNEKSNRSDGMILKFQTTQDSGFDKIKNK